jgi:RNA polymerase sigma-70 factor (ECF subfamily)
MSEDEWIQAYRETVRELYGYVSRHCGGDAELAEDTTQEAYLRAVSEWKRRAPADPLAWLRTVARNLLINHFKRLRPRTLSSDVLDLEQETLEPRTQDAARLLSWGLSRLRALEAELIEEHHLSGLSIRDIAHARGLSERAVEGRLRRSRRALQRILAPFLEEDQLHESRA